MLRKFLFIISILIISMLFSCNNLVFDNLDHNSTTSINSNDTTVKFQTKGLFESESRLVQPYNGYNKSLITNIELKGLKYNSDTNIYDLTIQKSYTNLNNLINDTLNVTAGTWNFTINAKQSGLPDLHDSVFITINSGTNTLIEFNLKNYDQYNFIYNVYVPTNYNTNSLYFWMWSGKQSFSATISDSTKITTGTYANYTKYVVELYVPVDNYFGQMYFYDTNNTQIGCFYDSVLIRENNLTEGNVIVSSLEPNLNYSQITLKYPVNPDSTTLTWNTTTVKAIDGRNFIFPTTCSLTGYAVADWYLTSDYTGDPLTNKIISSNDTNIYYAKCVPVGLSGISFSDSYIMDKTFSTDETNYTIFCQDDNTESYINIIPTLMKPQKSSLNSYVYHLNKIDGNSIEIKVISNEKESIYRTYTFTFSKKNTVAYYATVIPTYTAGSYNIKPYYTATLEEYKNLINSIVNNTSIVVNLDLSSVSGIKTIPQSTSTAITVKNIKSLILPNTVETINSMAFYNWTGLTSITLPDSLSEIQSNVFTNDTNLRGDFYISKNLKDISGAAISGTHFDTLTISSQNPNYEEYNGLLLNKEKNKIIALIGNTEFENNNFIIPSNIDTIGNYAFAYSDIEYINIPSSIKTIEGFAFYYSKLKSITLPYSIQSMDMYTFGYCSSLERADLSRIGTNDIGNYAFMSNTNLQEVILPEGMASIPDYTFYQCSNLTTVNIPSSIKAIGQMAFFGCSNCTTITIPENVETIGLYAFYNAGLTGVITIPNKVKSIEQMAFYNCPNITSLIIGTSLTKIPSMCFYNCSKLQSVTIPNNVIRIETNAFGSCTKLTNAIFGKTTDWTVKNNSTTKAITLSNTQTAATYLKRTYSSYDWYCTSN